MKITTTTGPRGRGTYVHNCHNTTFCAHAGGIGDGCGGTTEFTPAPGNTAPAGRLS